ncbi:MAG: SAM-dependent DNA methyltransferase [Nitrospirae bacterium]|nr:SAM-dependent DNA methyltransferase [Nitrospirota bacterium]
MARSPKENKNQTEEPLEKKLWKAADKLRKNMDAAEYKHIVLGLIFLKYISDAFEELYQKLTSQKGEGADPEDKNEYTAEKVFYVPPSSRWGWLQGRAKLPTIGKDVDEAMDAIEKDNPSLRGVLPKVFAQEKLDKQSLGGLIDLIGSATLGTKEAQSKDVLGKVYEYFLGEFALAEGKKGGQFYTPGSVVKLLVAMLEPYEGRVFDPCCGSGGMFVQSEKFVEAHRDYYKKKKNGLSLNPADRISIYGQESNQTTWRLAKMNLAIRHIDSSNVKWNNEGSFLNDMHKDLKADYIIANPPFNDSDWSGELLRDDARWSVLDQKLPPPPNNANYAWIQHFLFHLAPAGQAGFVLADTSMTTMAINEERIRINIIESNFVDCLVSLPSHLFTNTQITACLWFISRNKENHKFRNRKNEVLFIDASKMGHMLKRKHRALSDDDIRKISETYHNWRNPNGNYEDIDGFCRSVTLNEVQSNNYILSPNSYITPIGQTINLKIDFKSPSIANKVKTLHERINQKTDSILKAWNEEHHFKLNEIFDLAKLSKDLESVSQLIFKGLIKKYFLDYQIDGSEEFITKPRRGRMPKDWIIKSFDELFEESSIKVDDLNFSPPIYSVTNAGIQLREEKYTKALSKDISGYKVAYFGDMVFGLSREIPNLDVFNDEIGAFSGAYHIFRPRDFRIGIIVGTVMRLKLNEQTDLLKGGAREGRGLDKDKLKKKKFAIPPHDKLNLIWDMK